MRVPFVLAWLLFNSATFCAIPQEGWYVGFLVGPSLVSNLHFSVTNPLLGIPTTGKLTYAPSVNGDVHIGYRVDKFRFEAQGIYNKSSFKSLDLGNIEISADDNNYGLNMSGNTRFVSGMINVYYEFYREEAEIRLVPYIGLGAGFASVQNIFNLNYRHTSFYARNDTAYAPMGQGIAGLSFFATDNHSVGIDYRYMSTPRHQRLNSSVAVQTINFFANLSFN